jgi:hypothetical protein
MFNYTLSCSHCVTENIFFVYLQLDVKPLNHEPQKINITLEIKVKKMQSMLVSKSCTVISIVFSHTRLKKNFQECAHETSFHTGAPT